VGERGESLDHVNIHEVGLSKRIAHDGMGHIGFARLAEATGTVGACNFIDLAVVPPGASIGRHRHSDAEEEFYLVLDGTGTMWCNGEEFSVRSGDLIRNRPGGEHGLENTGDGDIRLFVFEVGVDGGPRT